VSAALALSVILYTVGPTSDFTSRFGHSVLCLRDASHDAPEAGHCYDYGVPATDDVRKIVWSAIRNEPGFTPVKVDEPLVVAHFEQQGRQIERQRIALSPDETRRLEAMLEDDVREKRAYAYHPYWANCATKLRDHLDAASGGRLHAGTTKQPPGTLREYMEDGHSGHLGTLLSMALFLGEENEHVPTAWEAMLLPSVLRDAVAERFDAAPEKIDERVGVVLPTSRAIGRVGLVALGFALLVALRKLAERERLLLGLRIAGGALGGLALMTELAAILVRWPEISHNWALALLLPTDAALPYLPKRWLALYAKLRIAMAASFVALEIGGVVRQPMMPLAALVALPMIGVLAASRVSQPSSLRALPNAP
jgi:hypothetical protein